MTEQLSLFSGTADPATRGDQRIPAAPPPVESLLALASRLPAALYLGTSSWSFPGWAGIVYDTPYDAPLLARSGLPAYSAHPLLRTASIDRTYYAPVDRAGFEAYARQVPEDFRFVVKAPAEITAAWLREEGTGRTIPNEHYLSADRVNVRFVDPVRDGLGAASGPLLLQFPPQGRSITSRPRMFASRVAAFLSALPSGPVYAIELRDVELWTDELVAGLQRSGVRPCVSVHPRAPSMSVQRAILASLPEGPLIVRWNLHPRHRYEEAKANYAPFDRRVDPDEATCDAIAAMSCESLFKGQPVFIVANNKAEGSAPLTIVAVAEAIAARL